MIGQARTLSNDFLAYNDAGPSPYHVVAESAKRLKAKGFFELKETDDWTASGQVKAGGKYYITRGGSSLVGFTCGAKFNKDTSYFKIIGTHTDSPCIRLAPSSKLETLEYHMGYIQTYGGGLWHTWFDRDLIVAGRVLIKGQNGTVSHKLYRSTGAIAKISELCIHLRKDRATVTVNPETHLRVLWSTYTFDKAEGAEPDASKLNHYRLFWKDVATQCGCGIEDILDFDLCFADAQAPALVGLNQEFISAARIDNLFSSWAALRALDQCNPTNDANCNISALFDHEEIGSETITGANSRNILNDPRASPKHYAQNLRSIERWKGY